jgi:hypothetical protein
VHSNIFYQAVVNDGDVLPNFLVTAEVLMLSLPVSPRKSIYSISLMEPPPEVVPPVTEIEAIAQGA